LYTIIPHTTPLANGPFLSWRANQQFIPSASSAAPATLAMSTAAGESKEIPNSMEATQAGHIKSAIPAEASSNAIAIRSVVIGA
jgi:hypothetical protein